MRQEAMEIITANSLKDGRVVFRTAGGWSPDVNRAEVLETKQAVAAALARAQADATQNIVVEPYAIAVTRNSAGIVPTRLRERIRSEGPTTGNSKTSVPAVRGAAA
jgi:sulfite reductase (NADPH) hemoprotein beta-component